MDRQELISQMMKEYELELRQLSDTDLYRHFQFQRDVKDMTDEDWRAIRENK